MTPETPSQGPNPYVEERPMCFYLGSEYDLQAKKKLDTQIMYDAKDLTTHGVVVGMTGSGKTGLCIGLLEEAAIDGIPSIIIDPKGDLSNLLLQFPELRAEDFREWLTPGEAQQKEMTPKKYSEYLADLWRKGLEGSKQPTSRIQLLKDSSEWRIYTPGSEAGLSLSVLKNFAAPQGTVLREQLNQRIDATATALLGLTGTASDPVTSREHILIAQILLHAWKRGEDLDLPQLIQQIQFPPLNRIGAFDVETFYPEKDRLKLAIALNNILAAPSFSTWIEGEPLDLSQMLFTPEGKPRQLIFYIAHLDDAQRQFFVTLLLEEVLNWTRKQPGTSSLRALLYFDEVYGYLPPHPHNPPTKIPLMTMMKQARAFGVGVLLATQNPVDIDYKALSNAGTWFIGKLQTERDKARLIEGLENVAAEHGALSNRNYLENVISSLGSRVFLLNNVHRGKPTIFQTRFALSYLRGPMTRNQIAKLMEPVKAQLSSGLPEQSEEIVARVCSRCEAEAKKDWKFCPFCGLGLEVAQSRLADEDFKHSLQVQSEVPPALTTSKGQEPPALPDSIAPVYVALSSPARPAEAECVIYRAKLLGMAEVLFSDRKLNIFQPKQYTLITTAPDAGTTPAWHEGEMLRASTVNDPVVDAVWEEVPSALTNSRGWKAMEKGLIDYLYSDGKLTILQNTKLDLIGEPGEDVMSFQAKCRRLASEAAEEEIRQEQARYRPKFAALGASLPQGNQSQTADSVISNVVHLLSWVGVTTRRQASKVDRIKALEAEYFARLKAVYEHWQEVGENYETVFIKPLKKDIRVLQVTLGWVPYWKLVTAKGVEILPAYR